MTKILPTPFEEQHGVVYYSFCGTENCSKNYFFKSARRLNEKNILIIVVSHLIQDSLERTHYLVLKNDFKMQLFKNINNYFSNNVYFILL